MKLMSITVPHLTLIGEMRSEKIIMRKKELTEEQEDLVEKLQAFYHVRQGRLRQGLPGFDDHQTALLMALTGLDVCKAMDIMEAAQKKCCDRYKEKVIKPPVFDESVIEFNEDHVEDEDMLPYTIMIAFTEDLEHLFEKVDERDIIRDMVKKGIMPKYQDEEHDFVDDFAGASCFRFKTKKAAIKVLPKINKYLKVRHEKVVAATEELYNL